MRYPVTASAAGAAGDAMWPGLRAASHAAQTRCTKMKPSAGSGTKESEHALQKMSPQACHTGERESQGEC